MKVTVDTKKKKSYYRTQTANACRNWNMYLTGKLENWTCISFRPWPHSLFQLPNSITFWENSYKIFSTGCKTKPKNVAFLYNPQEKYNHYNFLQSKKKMMMMNYVRTKLHVQVHTYKNMNIKEKLW